MNTARLFYALITWLVLWVFSGGTIDLFWSRLPLGAVLLTALAVVAGFVYPWEYKKFLHIPFSHDQLRKLWLYRSTRAPAFKETEHLSDDQATLSDALQLKWVAWPLTSLLLVTLVAAYGSRSPQAAVWLRNSVINFTTHDVIRVVLLTLLAGSFSFLSRALLQREWGLGNVVFLMSITLGFASQQFGVFLLAAITGALYGLLAERVNTVTAVVGETLWFLIFFVSLGFAS